MKKGRLKQKSHFQTTSLYPSAKSLTLKRHNPKRAAYHSRLRPAVCVQPFLQDFDADFAAVFFPIELVDLFAFAVFRQDGSRRVCIVGSGAYAFGIRSVGGRLKRFDEYEGRLKT